MSRIDENLTREDASRRAGLLRDIGYEVNLDLTQGDERFGSRTRVRFLCTRPGATTFIDCTAAAIERAELNGRQLPTDAIGDTRIRLDDLGSDNELIVDATMGLQHEGRGLHHFRDPADGRVYLHSQSEPFDAHLIYACFDQPDLKATFTLSVDAPEEWVVVSNMPAAASPEQGAAGRWRFEPTPLVPTYITAVVAGSYVAVHDEHDGIPLAIYARRSMIDHLETAEIFGLTKQGLDWFTDVFQQPYPFAKYDQLFVPEFSAGAMENPGCVTFSETFVFRSKVTDAARERRAEVLLHEMAHMWFGDLVTMRWWDDLWLNESFATFMSVLAQVSATRFQTAWVTFLDSEKAWAKFQDQLPSTHPIADDMPDVESVHQNFDGITYAKGASVLRQLVAWVGQDEFLAGCREYFRRHAWGNAVLRDFLAALEEASGRDLDAWRAEWLQTTGVNTLELDIEDDGEHYTAVSVVQRAPDDHPTLRRHRVAIGAYDLDDGRLRRRERVELDVSGARTEVTELVGRPVAAVLLPNDDDLTYAKVNLDERSLATLTDHLDAFAEPLPMALVWSATWDMVRDARLPARRFIELVIRNLAGDAEVGVLQRLLARASGAADRYGDPANRPVVRDQLAVNARHRAAVAEPGSDHQLAWVRHWAVTARTGPQLADVRRLLDGELELPGLAVDTDLRWHLIAELVAAGAAGDDVVAAELERDPTDLGERHAAATRASRPSPEAKAAAWEQLVEQADLSHTMARELFSGFQRLDQPDVLAPYTERYFDVLPRIWKERNLDWAIEFSSGTFPHHAASPELVERVDAFLDDEVIERPLRRVLLEERDTLVRTLRARALDASS